MDLTLLEPRVQEILKNLGFRLYSMRYLKEGDEHYLRVIVDKYHHAINLEEIVKISEEINKILDESNDDEAFTLDVTTTGAEKEVSLSEIKDYVSTYLKVTLKDGIKGPSEITGTLETKDEETLTLVINIKGRMKKEVIPLAHIKEIHRAIKF